MPDNNNAKPKLEDFEVETVFEDRVHERFAFTFKIEGDEFKGHFHEDEIYWLHPHPQQKHEDEIVQAMESEIHEKVAEHEQNSKDEN